MTDVRPQRMYTTVERDTVPRDLWGFAHYVDYVESGPSRPIRLKRLEEVPAGWRHLVQDRVARRAARAAREGVPG
jgi:hypothetical protein